MKIKHEDILLDSRQSNFFKDNLNELDKRSMMIEWDDENKGHFIVDCNPPEKYEFEFDIDICVNKQLVGFKFFRIVNDTRVSKYIKSKEPLTVMFTIRKAIKTYIDKNNPEYFAFIGDENEPKRVIRYRNYTKLLAKSFGYYWDETSMQESSIFLLHKSKNIDDCIKSIKTKF